jgi:hypothetical protein
MQTKLKPLFFTAVLAAAAMMLYATSDMKAQPPAIGIMDVSAFPSGVLTISSKLNQHPKAIVVDSVRHQSTHGKTNEPNTNR